MLTPEDIDSLVAHPGFEALSRRIDEMMEQAKSDLASDLGPEATWKARGAVAMMRTIQGLPVVLREEAEKGADVRRPRR